MSEHNWWSAAKDFFSSFGTQKTTAILPAQEYRFNPMYPYTVEQTTRVTHHTKPKKRDPSRRWKNK